MDMIWTDLHLLNRDVILLRNIGKEYLAPAAAPRLATRRVGTWAT